MEYFESCPKCGNINTGGGEGTFRIAEGTFERTCKCGWHITVIETFTEKGGESK